MQLQAGRYLKLLGLRESFLATTAASTEPPADRQPEHHHRRVRLDLRHREQQPCPPVAASPTCNHGIISP